MQNQVENYHKTAKTNKIKWRNPPVRLTSVNDCPLVVFAWRQMKLPYGMGEQGNLRSVCAFAQSDQSISVRIYKVWSLMNQ